LPSARTDRRNELVRPDASGLGEVLGMKVDAGSRTLVAAAAALPPARRGAGIFRFDLASGRLISRSLAPPGALHLWNDLVLTPRGEVVVTDSEEGTVYRVPAAGGPSERLLPAGSLLYPNGIALAPDGRRAYVAHALSISILDLASRRLAPLGHPPAMTLVGVDGLYWHRGHLIAVQNGVVPPRIVDLGLDASGGSVVSLTALEWRSAALDVPTTGAIAGDTFYFMADPQTEAMDDDGRLLRPLATLKPIAVRALPL
jgi:hypothetical protein